MATIYADVIIILRLGFRTRASSRQTERRRMAGGAVRGGQRSALGLGSSRTHPSPAPSTLSINVVLVAAAATATA
eukprot:1949487-Rhodomonas_salina.1